MYREKVKAGRNSYSYYYHNVKIDGKVRNVCLGTDHGKAKRKLTKLMHEKRKKNKPICRIIGDYWKPASIESA